MKISTHDLARDLAEMGVMGEEQHLRRPRQLGQHLEAGAGAVVVEVYEQVVGKKRVAYGS